MNVLLDECVPWPMHRLLAGHACTTAQKRGWGGIKNGDLLRLAEAEFDLFITSDQNIRYQQNLAGRRIRAANSGMPRVCPALPDAGGVTEISRWSSELGERTPPDHRHHSHAPRRVRRESSGSFRHPLRGAFDLPMRSGGFERSEKPGAARPQGSAGGRWQFARASLDHRLISIDPPGQMRWTAGLALPSLRAGTPAMTDTPPEFAEDLRKCAGDSGRREAGGKELAKQKAGGQGCGSSRCQFVGKGAEVCAMA